MPITHAFVNPHADGTDHTLTKPSDWNAAHVGLVAADIPAIAESGVTGLVTDLASKAPFASPALTGVPTAPTASPGDNSTILATTAFVSTAVAAAGTVTSVGLAAPVEFTISGSPVTGSGTLTFGKASQPANQVWAGPTSGAPAAPTFRQLVSADVPSSAALTGTPTAPTPTTGDNSTKIATTAFVTTAIAAGPSLGSLLSRYAPASSMTIPDGYAQIQVGPLILASGVVVSVGGGLDPSAVLVIL